MKTNDWEKEWVGMPEYKQTKHMPHKELIVRFKSQKDVDDFFKLINQKEPYKLKSIWFPKPKNKFKKFEVYTDKENK